MTSDNIIEVHFNKYIVKALYVKGGCEEVDKYNFTMTEGTTKYLKFSIYDDNTGRRMDLSNCDIEFYMINGKNEIKKDILISSSDTHLIQVEIAPDDTIGQKYFNYQLLMTESNGDVTQLIVGTISIENSISLHDPRSSIIGSGNMADGGYSTNPDGTIVISIDGGEL